MQARRCLQLAACNGIVELGQRETIAPDARTDTRLLLQAHRLHAGVLYAQRESVSPLNFYSLRQAPDVLTFYQGKPQAPPTREYPAIFAAGLIRLSCIRRYSCNRECKRDTRLSILSIALTFLSQSYVTLLD